MQAGLKVAVDAFNISMERGTGIATYGRNLCRELRSLDHKVQLIYGPTRRPGKRDLFNQIALVDPVAPERQPSKFDQYVRKRTAWAGQTLTPVRLNGDLIIQEVRHRLPPSDLIWAGHDVFNTARRAHQFYRHWTPIRFKDPEAAPDIVHWTTALPMRAPKRRNLYTMHDLVPLRLPFTTLDNKRAFFHLCRKICRTADHIVTVSDSAKDDLQRLFRIEDARVSTTYQSVHFQPEIAGRPEAEVMTELENVFSLPWRGYFLFFGAIEPKKNLARVIEAYLSSGVSAPLVIIGAKAWLDEQQTQLMYPDIVGAQIFHEGVLRRSNRIRRYKYLPFRLLVSMIRGARATLLPSLYEGFGLPVLESMLLGTPVLASTGGSLPEVAGDAALLVDPYDASAISRAIRALDADEGLRDEYTRRGRERAKRFSPEAHRDRLRDVYSRLS